MRKPHIITIAGAGSARVPALVGTLVQYKERFPVSPEAPEIDHTGGMLQARQH